MTKSDNKHFKKQQYMTVSLSKHYCTRITIVLMMSVGTMTVIRFHHAIQIGLRVKTSHLFLQFSIFYVHSSN